MKTCSSCGARNATDGTFCIRCGASLTDLDRDPRAGTDAFAAAPERVPDTLVDRAATQLADGDAAGAIENCRRAVALDPRHVEAYAVLGMAHEQTGDLPAALHAYDTVLGLAPDRPVERQKASLLRLRLGHTPPPAPRPVRHGSVLANCTAWVKEQVQANPPLAAGIGAAVLVLILGSVLLVSAGRAQARAALKAQYDREVLLARQAFAAQEYAEATAHYGAAWQLTPGDTTVRGEWEQAYRLAQLTAAEQARAMEIAASPKYIPNTTGRNPFEPVPIGGTPPPAATTAATPAMAMPATAVPPPTVNSNAGQYETWRGTARTTTPSPTTGPPSSRREIVAGGNRIITPVAPKQTEKPATTAPDTSGKTSKSEITIWVSNPKPAPKPSGSTPAATPSGNDAAALRAQGEQLGREGRAQEAIGSLERAANAYEDLARRDPTNAAAHGQAAETCRTRIEILRQNHR